MADLDRALRDLGQHLDYPAAPDLAGNVRRRITASAAPRRHLVLSTAMAVVVFLLSLLGFWAPAREAVADLFGLRGVLFSRQEAPVRPGERLSLGRPVSLEEAGKRVDFPVRLFPRFGAPDAIYADDGAPEAVVSTVYAAGAALPEVRSTGVGLLVSQFRGRFDTAIISKFFGPKTTVEAVSVNGHRGFWLPEPAHVVLFLDREGNLREDTARLTANVLLWEEDGVITRLESRLGKDQMLAIATRPG
ncbi:MAG TPA: hypothetical protein VEG38_17525 [Acidimicrobiia bacterium]|nr:hypothetical protein [Acidimicrobiia bacterium]